MPAWVVDLLNRLNSTFVVDGRWQWFVSGLGYTLLISLFSVLLGLVIGILMALMRLSKSKILRAVSGIYIDIIRGTPTMVQLLIIYFVIFANVHIDKWVVGFIAFGINSGAYIAEIVRGGILSVNIGQTEAGRSLGMTHKQTENIFHPFITYKPEGTGLGLAVTAEIISAHHGQIRVSSTPGQGSAFYIYLPASPE